jgi:hypothetical protein
MALPDGDFVRVLPRRGGLDALLLDAAGDRVVAHGMQEHRGLRRPLPLPVVPRPYCMDLSPDGRHLVVGGRERAELTVLDAESFVWEPPLSLSAPPVDLAFAPDGTLHVATADGTLWRGDAARLEAAGAADIRAFVRGRPEWALTADALIRADADARVAGLQRPVTACARSA